MDKNPYQSPEASGAEQGDAIPAVKKSANEQIQPLDRILVQIHSFWIGTNLLGILLVLAWVFLCWAVVESTEALGPILGGVLLLASLLVVGSADVLWRLWRSRRVGLWRFALPFEGGALAYLPVCFWMFGSAILAILLSVIAIVRINR